MCARIGQISPRIGSTSTSAAKPIGHNWAFSRSATCCRTLRGSRADFGLDLLNGIHPAGGDNVVFPAAGNCVEGWQRAYDRELQSVFISCPRLARLAHCLSRQGKRYDMTPAMGTLRPDRQPFRMPVWKTARFLTEPEPACGELVESVEGLRRQIGTKDEVNSARHTEVKGTT
jgi:hypothetical protein